MSVTRTSRAHARAGFLATGISVFVLWNLATLAGALAGTALGDPRTYGLDAAVAAAFLGLLWPRLQTRRDQLAAVAAAALALSLVPHSPAGRAGARRAVWSHWAWPWSVARPTDDSCRGGEAG